MPATPVYEFWLATGSQELYGNDVLAQVDSDARAMVEGWNRDAGLRYPIVAKPVLTTPDAIRRLCVEANLDDRCAGVIAWMHTFSPAKMWIGGIAALQKPLLHLHTQFHRDIPWDSIDMEYMNLHQSAHGDREFAYLVARLGTPQKVIAGHWRSPELWSRVGAWMDVAAAHADTRRLRIARFGDNMRDVAVTEADKVEAEIRLGWSVNGYDVGDLAERVAAVADADVDRQVEAYADLYAIGDTARANGMAAVREQARIELGLRAFLSDGGFSAFTTNFQALHGLRQLPGLAVQRLMADGYGFGAEGDWKSAGLVRLMKVIDPGRGTSFMEDYTYHLEPGNELVLGAHMLEVCPSIAKDRPVVEVHPLSIGGKEDPARLVFDGKAGPAVCASLVDMGDRLRLVVNRVQAVEPEHPMPRLPVGRVLWRPEPSLVQAAEAWMLAGGAHHTGFSYGVSVEQLEDWAEMAQIECVVIDEGTNVSSLRERLRRSDRAWRTH
jgi:L-arabinose isomerase